MPFDSSPSKYGVKYRRAIQELTGRPRRSFFLFGIALPPDFPADLPREQRDALREASAEAVAEAAHAAESPADFFTRIRKP